MYNERYISNFSENDYHLFLLNPKKLEELGESYVNQYTNLTYEKTLAFKESLDHYVLKQLKTDPYFYRSKEYYNYCNYVYRIFINRVSNYNSRLEFNTNIVFRDREIRNKILNSFPENYKNQIYPIIEQNDKNIDIVREKIKSGHFISQDEMDLYADYLYTLKDLKSNEYHLFIDYIINVNPFNNSINMSPKLAAAFISYLPKAYGNGVENSRIFLTNGYGTYINAVLPSELDNDKDKQYIGLYSHGDKFISIDYKWLKNMNLSTDKSLNISRTVVGIGHYDTEEERNNAKQYNDLYWISFVCFHELTHQFQTLKMNSRWFDNSGLSMIINYLRFRNSTINNHDTIESEIEADEKAWDMMHKFIRDFRTDSSYSKYINREQVSNQSKRCLINKDAIFARRVIKTKKGAKQNYFESDVEEFKTNMQDPNYQARFKSMLKDYPMLNMFLSENGTFKVSVLLQNNITSVDNSGNNENIIGCELCKYILTNGLEVFIDHLKKEDITENQLYNLCTNIYNIYHLEKLFLKSFLRTDLLQFSETSVNFDYNDIENLKTRILEKFKSVADVIYRERYINHTLKTRGQYKENEIDEYLSPKYEKFNYIEVFEYLSEIYSGNIPHELIVDVVNKYEQSGDEVLVELANWTKNELGIGYSADHQRRGLH